jgi:hypothetical protein
VKRLVKATPLPDGVTVGTGSDLSTEVLVYPGRSENERSRVMLRDVGSGELSELTLPDSIAHSWFFSSGVYVSPEYVVLRVTVCDAPVAEESTTFCGGGGDGSGRKEVHLLDRKSGEWRELSLSGFPDDASRAPSIEGHELIFSGGPSEVAVVGSTYVSLVVDLTDPSLQVSLREESVSLFCHGDGRTLVLRRVEGSTDLAGTWTDPATGTTVDLGVIAGFDPDIKRAGEPRTDAAYAECTVSGKFLAFASSHSLSRSGNGDTRVWDLSDPSRPPATLPILTSLIVESRGAALIGEFGSEEGRAFLGDLNDFTELAASPADVARTPDGFMLRFKDGSRDEIVVNE